MSEDKEKIISEAVEKALQGDMDTINNIEDRVTRSKAKAALVKAKRAKVVSDEDSTKEDNASESKVEEKINFNQTLCKKISGKFSDSIDGEPNNDWIQLKPENWLKIAKWLKSDEELSFDSLQCNTGMDLGEGVLESRYNLLSMKHLHKVEIRIKVSAEKRDIPSVEQVWRVADWFERETYDMFGINFQGHPHPKRLLMPEDWKGWPLRKDYVQPDFYEMQDAY